MHRLRAFRVILFVLGLVAVPAATPLAAQGRAGGGGRGTDTAAVARVRQKYVKREVLIKARDGVQLFTAIYAPRDTTRTYPFLMTRTPYGVPPYGADEYPARLGPTPRFQDEGFIFVYQDTRGRFMSEGYFQYMTPHLDNKRGPQDVDESTDTYEIGRASC